MVLVFGLTMVSQLVYAASQEEERLQGFIQLAVEHNPKILAAYHQWKSHEYKIKSVKSLPDPKVSYTHFEKEIETRVGPQDAKYGFSQKFPFPGKLRLKGKAQSKQAQVLEKKYEAMKDEVIKEVKFIYYDLFWVDKAISVNEEEKTILERLEKVSQRKYESNLIPQQDVVKAQVELSKIIKKLILLGQNRKSLVAGMNRLLDRSGEIVIARIENIKNQSFEYTLETIVDKAKSLRQELMAAQLSVERAEYQKSLARMNYFPDFTFASEYIDVGGGTTTQLNDGEDSWMTTVSVNVPIWFGKLKAQVKEKESQLDAVVKNKEEMENQVSYESQDLFFKITAYKDIVNLYETALVPQAQQAFDVSQSGFETGKVRFLDWLDTERTYLQTRLAYYKAITDYHKSIALLERIVGEDL